MEKPIIAGKNPQPMEMEPGDYYWCSCGKSKNQPFCDGSHQGTGMQPTPVHLKEKKQVYWCMCKQTKNKPFCDGSHNAIK